VTQYQKVTLDEIARRNYTEGTTRAYLRALDDLARHFQRPPEDLTPEDIREYSAHLFRDRQLSGNTVNQIVGALRFFYFTVLNKRGAGTSCRTQRRAYVCPSFGAPMRSRA